MGHFKKIMTKYNSSNINATELVIALSNIFPIMDELEEQNPECFWKSMKNFHEHVMGEHYDINCAKKIYDKYIKNLNKGYNIWDVYVALNAQYHDYHRLYTAWYGEITEEDLDNKIILSAITFWFKDEDAKCGKVWNYFKNMN